MNVWSQFSDTEQHWSFICYNIYQGEGIERGGQHIHTFIPDDVRNFNASHIIHDLRFGPDYSNGREQTTLKGVTKIVTEENGEYLMSQCWMLCYFLNSIFSFIMQFHRIQLLPQVSLECSNTSLRLFQQLIKVKR